ncbi:RagB/SusD family nutrient uptake outer membrane protein [Riemerella columbipharyngis]|uniref:SusD family protein n=1 Tax=Riemerella columbipharyngis TaxID=1071918 RepID=A0A1G7C4H8_9FLAO|nr:RagB/SusD family nutrient uptake outer membrane protein [Riemerella columbipharyngis]SDE34294.1 SusD family protein [Riemerella columbipharyngis]
MLKIKNIKIGALVFGLALVGTSCSNDFVETKFYQNIQQGPLTDLSAVRSAIRGVYFSMENTSYLGRNYEVYAEIRSDEMAGTGRTGRFTTVAQYKNMLSSDSYAGGTYNQIYAGVYKTNIIINTDVNAIPAAQQSQVKYIQGQAKVLRGYMFFDLLRLYGQTYTGGTLGVVTPLVNDPKALQARGTIEENKVQIEKDFTEGLALMEANIGEYNNEEGKQELSIDAAKGLMARYFLYKGDYAKVRDIVKSLYGKYSVISADDYVRSWTQNNSSPNSIFEFAVGTQGAYGYTGIQNLYSPNGYANTILADGFVSKYEPKDVRLKVINSADVNDDNIDEYYLTGKYTDPSGADNIKFIRYEEILLDGVEAELQGGDAALALKYYNDILTNRGLSAATSVTLEQLKLERAKELLGEGFREWDLLRWGNTSFVPNGIDKRLLAFPIPRSETDIAGTPMVANPGYDN